MNRPTIGITVDCSDADSEKYELTMYYARSVERAGGLPVMLPYAVDLALVPQYIDLCDGLLFAGGNDLDPKAYGEEWHPKAQKIDPRRQAFEMALLAEVDRRAKPILGICLGSQAMNVYRGGSLIQFLPDIDRNEPIEHRRDKTWDNRHAIEIKPDTAIAAALGKSTITANSSHKQAVKSLGKGLRVIATAPDGVVEGIEDPSKPLFLGVQWHPERMIDQEDHLKLFELLVNRAAEARAKAAQAAKKPYTSLAKIPLHAATIDFELFCDSCQYELRGLQVGGRCPECGTTITRSLWTKDPVLNSDRKRAIQSAMLQPVVKRLGVGVDGLLFLLDALAQAEAAAGGAENQRLSAAQICAAVQSRINDYFNDRHEAEDLLYEWGIRDSEAVGAMISAMEDAQLLPPGSCELPPAYDGIFNLGNVWDKLK